MIRKCIAIIAAVAALHISAAAQKSQNAVSGRHGVALTLSGGGAKGLYHIGVLRALEENDIPIDYISGTSMGSIVAGLYAAGYSPEEMQAIAESGAVAQWVSGRPGQQYEALYRRKPENAAWVSLPLNVKERHAKFEIPSSLISSSQIDIALTGLFSAADAASGGDFDSLMVPFRCVAADMAARRPVVMESGSLGESIRASMSIPLAFRPVESGDMILYDGGIYNNFPWQTLDTEFRPEVLVGSICTAGNTPPDADSSVLDQAFMLVMNDTDYTMPEGRSVIVRRAVPVGMLDFDRAADIIAWGYADALEQMPRIKEAVRARRPRSEVAERRAAFRARQPELIFGDYRIEGLSSDQNEYIYRRLHMRHRGEQEFSRMSFDQFRTNYIPLLAEGDFEVGFPEVSYIDSASFYRLSLPMRTRPKLSLQLGGNISSTAFNEAYIGLDYSTIGRVAQLLFADVYVGPLYSMGHVGGRTTFFSRRPLLLDYSYNFSLQNSMKGNFGNLTDVDNTRKMRRMENFLSLGLGFPAGNKGLFSILFNGGLTSYRYYEGVDENRGSTSRTRFLYVSPQLRFERNTFDRRQFPRRGSRLTLSGSYIYGRDRYLQSPLYAAEYLPELPVADMTLPELSNIRHWASLRFEWECYADIPSCRWFSIGMQVEAVVTNHPGFSTAESTIATAPQYTPTALSKMVYMPQFHADKFVGAGVMPTFDLAPSLMLRTSVYAMFRERFTEEERRMNYIADLSIIYHTRLGPVSLSCTKYDFDSPNNLYLTANFGFTIFGRKGFLN